MEKLKKASKFSQLFNHRGFQAAFGLLSLVIAYVFASWAIDSGSLLDYAITLLLIVVGLQQLAAAIAKRNRKI
jgi:uncharacterized membrane protein HdeD (DUF308 family)